MPYANNKMVLADGRITLYLRDDVKNPVWQCRITMKSVRGYIKRSTGESDVTRATMVAIKLLGELEHRSANDQPLSAKRFKDIAAAYLRDAHTRWKEGRVNGREVYSKPIEFTDFPEPGVRLFYSDWVIHLPSEY